MAKILVVLSVALAVALAGVPRDGRIVDPGFDGRIVGGSDAPDGKYTYQISLRFQGNHSCGGSIINNEWILTAAHCCLGATPQDLSVYAGSTKRSSGGTSYKVLEIHAHEAYDPIKIKNDVALLKVEPITYSDKIGPVVVDDKEIVGNENCTLSGWGMLWFPWGPLPENLQHIDLITTTLDYCKKENENINPVGEGEICTYTKRREGFCKGDSGGPLVRTDDGIVKQIGIVSWTRPCARGYPDAYVRVSYYYSWIKQKCNNCI